MRFFSNFISQKFFRVAAVKQRGVKFGEEFLKIFRVVANPMSPNREGIRDGTLGVWWMAATIVEVLLFISGLDVNRCLEFVVAR